LYARGADLKHIADLLGHRSLSTTNSYAQVDLQGLRALAQPWPI
jgi:site-specific recombinase XerD